ncbi:hypothetical protein [Massilia sp. BJB1822]|uniref:hypothetical protein n=1 Tax=Massilia sp. BJB1822 TaxID=2744470 RepID=UPI00159490B2|nr:hypothetical protein [Massilia sp. BJB1822]NVD99814.1 hypothetical protein [Massilia sp. BJB1822]
MAEQLIDTFIEKLLDFDLQIREKRGLNEALHEELIELLKQIKPRLEGQHAIPKKLAEVFLDMWGPITSSADMYDSAMRQKIYEAADQLCWYARDICTS